MFAVSGDIRLADQLRINRADWTLAGQTAPGDGIVITHNKINLGGSQNFIIRNVRFRCGQKDVNGQILQDQALGVENCNNYLFDHCVVGWSMEENMNTQDCHFLTVQNTIVHEGLYNAGHKKGKRGYGTQWGGSPASYYRNLLADNIVFEGKAGEAQRPGDAFCICRRFHTIDQILMRMMKKSDNLYAESMFYQLAASTGTKHASAKQARGIINKLISKVGLNPKRYEIADGSGLSLYNYLSAELEVQLLRYAFRNNNIYMHLRPSLPIAGEDGTLRKRMKGVFTAGNVHAKTGTVQGVSSLAGYCTAANGHHLAFSIINQGIQHHSNGRAFPDRVCPVLCQP